MEGESAINPVRNGAAFAHLRRLKTTELPEHRCDLCAAALDVEHRHIVELATVRVLCACQACSQALTGSPSSKYSPIPPMRTAPTEIRVRDEQWQNLQIPVALAFFYIRQAPAQISGVYPSPAGPTTAEIEPGAWADVVAGNPVLETLLPYVEALLVNRMNGARDALLVPIDEAYRLVGIVRDQWQGFSGGVELQRELTNRLAELKQRAGIRS